MAKSKSKKQPVVYDKEAAFDKIVNRVAELHQVWRLFLMLYGHSPERVELLKRRTGWLFGRIHKLIVNYMFYAISRLNDPPTSATGDESLVLQRIIADLSLPANSAEMRKIESYMTQVKNACRKIRQIRNKVVAHSDLATMLKLKPSEDVIGHEIEEAIAAITSVVQLVAHAKEQQPINFHLANEEEEEEDGDQLHALLNFGLAIAAHCPEAFDADLTATQKLDRGHLSRYMSRYEKMKKELFGT